LRSNSLLCRSLPGRSRQGSLGLCWRRMLRSLACLGFLALFVNIKARFAVQTHAAKLHGGTINCIVSRHNNCLLLLLHSALEACAPAGCGGCTVGADGKAADRRATDRRLLLARNRGEVARVGRANGAGSGQGGRRVRVVGEVFDVLLGERFVRGNRDCDLASSGTLGCLNSRLRHCFGDGGFDRGLGL
jgi:hypothetical protein